MNGLRKNAKNLHFWAFWAKMGKTGIFFKKTLGKFFPRLQALTNYKVSEKSNEPFSSNRVTCVRTYVRTWFLRSLTTSTRDKKCWFFQQKMRQNLNFRNFKKCGDRGLIRWPTLWAKIWFFHPKWFFFRFLKKQADSRGLSTSDRFSGKEIVKIQT